MSKMILEGNKGDWSELYVFAKLLADGKLYQADTNLNRNEDVYYEVTRVYREDNGTFEYDRADKILIYEVIGDNKNHIATIDIGFFEGESKKILTGIINGSGLKFNISNLDEFIAINRINKLTALNTSKSDIRLRIYDHRLSKEEDLGFSIKSLLGTDSTLFNTGSGNNFIYEVSSQNLNEIDISEFNTRTIKPEGKISKLTHRIIELLNLGATFTFEGIQSPQLYKNLRMIDGDLPQLLGHALLFRWIYRESELKKVVHLLETHDPMNFYNNQESEQKLYEYKIKRFLAECAMGMTSETPWMGIYDATGGIIIVKEDGEIVCFHIYSFNLFREYLLDNTKFEQPSTGEDGENPGRPRKTGKNYYYGWLYEEDNAKKFKINLQVRFK